MIIHLIEELNGHFISMSHRVTVTALILLSFALSVRVSSTLNISACYLSFCLVPFDLCNTESRACLVRMCAGAGSSHCRCLNQALHPLCLAPCQAISHGENLLIFGDSLSDTGL